MDTGSKPEDETQGESAGASPCTPNLPSSFYVDWISLENSVEDLQKSHPALSSEQVHQIQSVLRQQARIRAAWQASCRSQCLGASMTLIALALLLLGIEGIIHQTIASRFLALIYAWSGSMGGAMAALYRFTHDFMTRKLTPLSSWWTLTKPVFGAVTGAIVAGLYNVGIVSIHFNGASTVLISTLLAFGAGFKEHWFMGWLIQLKPPPASSVQK